MEADPTWPQQYARLAARIRHALAPADLRIDHIGSTAVPGLAARDVIDIQLTVPTLADADGPLAERLAEAGFPRLPGEWWDDPARPAAAGGRSGCTAAPTQAAPCTCTSARPTRPAGGTRC